MDGNRGALPSAGWMRTLSKKLRNRGKDERGAALIEFALVMPLLVILLMGIIDYGWAFAQNIDVRHGAREAGRLAMVDQSEAVILSRTCAAMDLVSSAPNVLIDLNTGGGSVGDAATIDVTADFSSLTGLLDWALPTTLQSTVEIRLEQDATNWSTTTLGPCP